MAGTGPWLRVFVALLFAVLPPILLLVGTLLVAESLLQDADPNLVAVSIVVGALVWAAVLAIVYARALDDEFLSFLALAEKGEDRATQGVGPAFQQVAAALEERNAQIARLAREAAEIPIDDDPPQVLRALVSATRSVMRDATWRAAVLNVGPDAQLAKGVYHGVEDPPVVGPIGELEQWAAVTAVHEPVAQLVGPWGAFAVIGLSATERLSLILYAPWEGRGDLAPADKAVLTLVGQQASTALEHSLLYAEVRRQADELNRLAAIQADFLRGVTHDLQTPLTSIGAAAAELSANDTMPMEARADLDVIKHQADRLRRMVGQLLVASRLEAGVFVPQVEVFAIPPIVDRTWRALRADRPVELAELGRPHLAIGDPDRFEQALWAILDNAVKYSPAGSAVSVSIEAHEARVRVAVRDSGSGMDPETKAHAFDQFYRAGHARRRVPDGSGVGLYAARGMIQAMGGAVTLDSQLGSGTTVTIELPAEDAGDAEAEGGSPPSAASVR